MAKHTISTLKGGLCASLIVMLASCSNMTPTQQRTLSGAGIGAATGAAAGAITGGSPAAGAAIGGAVGAGAGYVYDKSQRDSGK